MTDNFINFIKFLNTCINKYNTEFVELLLKTPNPHDPSTNLAQLLVDCGSTNGVSGNFGEKFKGFLQKLSKGTEFEAFANPYSRGYPDMLFAGEYGDFFTLLNTSKYKYSYSINGNKFKTHINKVIREYLGIDEKDKLKRINISKVTEFRNNFYTYCHNTGNKIGYEIKCTLLPHLYDNVVNTNLNGITPWTRHSDHMKNVIFLAVSFNHTYTEGGIMAAYFHEDLGPFMNVRHDGGALSLNAEGKKEIQKNLIYLNPKYYPEALKKCA